MTVLFREFSGPLLCPRGSVVCIGAFDGLHLGHQYLLGQAKLKALELNVDLVVVSFEPLPREYFMRTNPPSRLILASQKIKLLREFGADVVGLLRFNESLANTSSDDFIKKLIVGRLNAKAVFIGPDFYFGKNRQGNVSVMQKAGECFGFETVSVVPQLQHSARISSSLIRDDLQNGRLKDAAEKLGRAYALEGKVVRGKQLGRTLGYPTANIRFRGKKPALMGIYATWVHGVGEHAIASVSSVGTRPTVKGVEPLLEAHLFDFDGDLYGKKIRIEFIEKLRDEVKFDGLDALVIQMDQDAEQARAILARHTLGECA